MTAPAWMVEFTERVAEHLIPVEILAPLGCHYYQDDQVCEVTLFASKTEIVGGRYDGGRRVSRFQVDVAGILAVFESVTQVGWQPHLLGNHDELGPHLSIEGTYQSQSIWLRITAHPPRRFGHGRKAMVNDCVWKDQW